MTNLFLGRDAFINFSVSVTGIVLIIPSLLWLHFGKQGCTEKSSNSIHKDAYATSSILFWLILIPLGILIAPGSSLIIQKLIHSQPYIDTMIVIPTALITVYAFMHLIDRLNIHGRKTTGAIICLGALIIASRSVFMTYGHPLGVEAIHNLQKISPETQAICELVGSENVLLPEEIYGQIGEFDSDTNASCCRDIIHNQYYGANTAQTAASIQAMYFVIRKCYDDPVNIEYFQYKKTAETKHYMIYQRSE